MTDETERPEDTVRRFAQHIEKLEGELKQHFDAIQLWKSLELKEGDQITEAVLIVKCADFKNGGTAISMTATDGVDWIGQLGMIEAARMMMRQENYDDERD